VEDRIQTQHPDPDKKGVRISRTKYDAIRAAILAALAEREPEVFYELLSSVEKRLGDSFEGSIGWYYTTVKLDLEARREIERIAGTSPQQLRRTRKS
jgi:hypothetical protein